MAHTNTVEEMVSPHWGVFKRLWWIVTILLLLLLLLLWLLGYGPNGSKCQVNGSVSAVTNTSTVDKITPRLSLLGDSSIRIPVGTEYKDTGTKAIDSVDGDVKVTVTGHVNSKVPGSYELIYTAIDSAGNSSSTTRTVIVEAANSPDKIGPRISLNDVSLLHIPVGSSFSDAGAKAVDDIDGDVTVSVTGSVDTKTPGKYQIIYTATDEAGNSTSETRTIIVDSAAPDMSLPETAKLYFELDSSEFPADTELSLAAVIAYLHQHDNAKAVISGFHDPSGNFAHNQELSKKRAIAVSRLLQESGINVDRMVLEKPAVTTGTGSAREARRVEVKVRQ